MYVSYYYYYYYYMALLMSDRRKCKRHRPAKKCKQHRPNLLAEVPQNYAEEAQIFRFIVLFYAQIYNILRWIPGSGPLQHGLH